MFVKKYKNGLTLIVETNTALRSVTAGIMVGTGSAYEIPSNNGISHFIEHMQFKGTKRRSAEQIVNAFDEAGATFNAFTSKEYTCFYFKSIDEKIGDCFDVLSDLFLHSEYDGNELDRERNVILEEINMSLDEPDGVCYDVLYRTAFGNQSLGMEILGTKENVKRFGKSDILAYKKTNYTPANTVVAFVGNIAENDAQMLVETYLAELVGEDKVDKPLLSTQSFSGGYGEFIRDFEQSELSIAYNSLIYGDENSSVLSVLDVIMGTGMGSRLFRRLREQMGVVYSIYSSTWLGGANGTFSICANVNIDNLEKSVVAIREEVDKIIEGGVTEKEVEKAKTQLKVNAMFGKENPMNYMLAVMRRRLYLDEEYDLDKVIERIESVTVDKVNSLAQNLLTSPSAIAYAGKKPNCNIAKIYNERR